MSSADHKLLDLFDTAVAAQESDMDSMDIKRKYAECLYIQKIYRFNNSDLVDHMDKNPALRKRIGIQKDIHNSTISRKNDDNKAYYDIIKSAAERSVLSLYSKGVKLPDQVLKNHGLESDPDTTVNNATVKDIHEQEANLQWAELFLSEIVSPLTFNRSDKKSKDITQFIGLAAHSALEDVSAKTARDTARYNYPISNIPSGSSLHTYIREIADPNEDNKINYISDGLISQFEECYGNFFDLIASLGAIDGEELFLVDTTKIPSESENDNTALVSNITSNSGNDKYRGWGYQLVGSTGDDSVYIHSILPYYSGSEIQERLDRQLQWINDDPVIDITMIVGDKKYYKRDVVEVCRKHLGDDWLICAEVDGDIKRLIRKTPDNMLNKSLTPDFGETKLLPEPNAFVYPNRTEKGVTLADFDNIEENDRKRFVHTTDHRSHIGYLTDQDLDEDRMRKLHLLYQQRDSIESPIGQIKDIYLPYTESESPAIRYYLMALSGLFYNFHQLINRSFSPKRGIPLDITGKEFLTGVKDVALSSD